MSCIPHSGGCERPATDALANHLNCTEGTHYEHLACLDQVDRTRPQPECLYVDTESGHSLVVERKSISWPESYPYHHSKDHDLARAISEALSGIDFQTTYTLSMPSITPGTKSELIQVGRFVAEQIEAAYTDLQSGRTVNIDHLGLRFSFGIRPLEDRGDDEPDHGVVMTWPMSLRNFTAAELSEKLREQITKIYSHCERKFVGYPHARRILMLDPHGQITFTPKVMWNKIFTDFRPPAAIDEIWIGQQGTDDFGEEEWRIDQAYSVGLEFPTPRMIS